MGKLKNKFPKIMELNFRANHSLIIGNKPKKIELSAISKAVSENTKKDSIEKMGLFDSDSPNYVTYYPGVTPIDWAPQESDFIEPVFRAFSEVIVTKYGTPIDFSMNDIVKNSMKKLLGVTINPDHNSEVVGNALGSIPNVEWQEAYKVKGVKVPAGINTVLKIDAKSNPRIARGIMMDPPSIHSVSVTVRFKHERSHLELTEDDFWNKVGTFDKVGELIRLVVTEILHYRELSLVSHGADPFAQKINENGVINNPQFAKTVYGLSASEDGQAAFDFKEITNLSFSFDNKPNVKLKTNKEMTFEEFMASLNLSKELTFENEQALADYVKDLIVQSTALTALKAVNKDLTPDLLTGIMDNQRSEADPVSITKEQQTTLNKVVELGGLEIINSQVKLGTDHLAKMRAKVVSDYKLIKGDKADDTIIANINASDSDTVTAMETQYSGELENLMPLTCSACGSTEVSRASSGKSDEILQDNSFSAKRQRFANKRQRSANEMHGVPAKKE